MAIPAPSTVAPRGEPVVTTRLASTRSAAASRVGLPSPPARARRCRPPSRCRCGGRSKRSPMPPARRVPFERDASLRERSSACVRAGGARRRLVDAVASRPRARPVSKPGSRRPRTGARVSARLGERRRLLSNEGAVGIRAARRDDEAPGRAPARPGRDMLPRARARFGGGAGRLTLPEHLRRTVHSAQNTATDDDESGVWVGRKIFIGCVDRDQDQWRHRIVDRWYRPAVSPW